ncbi:unnamed protein product [Durusdinium trenchii]|uniref:Palmitoyltransferase n=1 Tax=Durusdinium trenchii TaxID=1381693 RepID=A0ABP0PHV0_9DINO
MQRCFGADQGPGRLKRRTIHKQSLLRTIRTLLHPGLGRVCAFSLVCSAILLQTDGNGADGLDGRVKAVAVYPTRCFLQVRSILTHPGEIPEDPKWEYLPRQQNAAPLTVQETKRSGERRHCKWCGKFKPDRCHHCRVCRTCVLKMDHHCPWIYNCVGFYNYKFFILLLVYSAIDCYLILFTMAESVHRCIYDGAAAFGDLFLVFFGQFLALVLAGLVSAFLGMHLWLIARGMTTIEFCEKFVPKDGSSKAFANSLYDLGVFRNFKATMGQNVAVWFLPIGVPDGDGLTFLCDETRLTQDHDAFCKTPEPSQLSRPPWTLYGTERWVDQPIDSP